MHALITTHPLALILLYALAAIALGLLIKRIDDEFAARRMFRRLDRFDGEQRRVWG